MKIEIGNSAFGKHVIINGYVIGPVVGDQFKVNGDIIYFHSQASAEYERIELIARLESDHIVDGNKMVEADTLLKEAHEIIDNNRNKGFLESMAWETAYDRYKGGRQ